MESSEEGRTLTYRRWHQELESLLISMGLHGAKQSDIVKYFKENVMPEDIEAYLEMLLKEDKAQKFVYNRINYWRATINILDEAYRS